MEALSVTQLVRKMKSALQFEVGEVWVEGEVSNLRHQSSGHRYFSIKDAGAQLPCVLFRGRVGMNADLIENGREVKLFGEITIYEAIGRAQMIVSKVKVGGTGNLQAKFEELKQKLNSEGLFATEHKKPIPKFPKRIGLVTSASGAALQDMLNIFQRRAPWVELFLIGVQVQGKGAERGIAHAIEAFNNPESLGIKPVDIIITGRGGGSIEDLWNFNEEIVARAIFDSKVPVISAVGHEIDFTIADFVADERAPTPSAAAEIAVPDSEGLLNYLQTSKARSSQAVNRHLNQAEEKLSYLKQTLERCSPTNMHLERIQTLDSLRETLRNSYIRALIEKATQMKELRLSLSYNSPTNLVDRQRENLSGLTQQLRSTTTTQLDQLSSKTRRLGDMLRTLGPESTLSRGFSITTNEKGEIIRSSNQTSSGNKITTTLHDGEVVSIVE